MLEYGKVMGKEHRRTILQGGLDRLGINQKEMVIPSDRYLFLDLDMTLIDESRNINDDSILTSIERLKNSGWKVGLNSNTPAEPLLVWMHHFGMNGPFIAEKGGVFFSQGKLVFDEKLATHIQSSREAIRQRISSMNVQLLLGNPTDVLREHAIERLKPGPLVILDTVRKCSVNFYVREVTTTNQLAINSVLLLNIVDAVRPLYSGIQHLEEELDRVKGSLLAMPKGQSKRAGARAFMREEKLTQVGIIGDSMNDFVGEDLAVHYAVGNATKDYKKKAVYVSEFPMAQGCKDIMQRLALSLKY